MAIDSITTERLLIRNWTENDGTAFHTIWGDPEVIWWGHSESLDQTREILANLIARGQESGLGWCAVVRISDDTIVGNVCLQHAPEPRQEIEIGWHIVRTQWANGYATEAASALLAAAWDQGFETVVADIVPSNVDSQRVAKRLGMERGPMIDRGGLIHDKWVLHAPSSS